MIPKCWNIRQLWRNHDFHILPGEKGIISFLQEFPCCCTPPPPSRPYLTHHLPSSKTASLPMCVPSSARRTTDCQPPTTARPPGYPATGLTQPILLGRGSFIKDPLLYFGGRFLFKLKLLAGVGEKAASFDIALSRSTSRHLPDHPRSVPPFQLLSAPPMNGPSAWNHPNCWLQHPLHVLVFMCFQPDLQLSTLLAVHTDHLLSGPSFQSPSAPPTKGPHALILQQIWLQHPVFVLVIFGFQTDL